MAISELHASAGSCKVVPNSASRCYDTTNHSNRNIRSQSPLSLGSAHALLPAMLLSMLLMLSSCLALPSESTTILPVVVDIAEVTTVVPPQQPVIETNSPPTVVSTVNAVNESLLLIDPIKSTAAETVDDVVHTSFVSLGGEGLEQGIRNAVKTEVELEIEANSSGSLVDTLQAEHADSEQKTTNTHAEHTDAAQGVREPKTLDAEAATAQEKDVTPTHVVVENDKLSQEAETEAEAETETRAETAAETAENPNKDTSMVENTSDLVQSKPETPTDTDTETDKQQVEQQVEQQSNQPPLPAVTSDLVAVIFDENRAITEQPITDTNQLVLQHEHEKVPLTEDTSKPIIEITKHQVTKKQGVDVLLPIESAEKPLEEELKPEILAATDSTPKATTAAAAANLNEIEENIIDTNVEDKKEQDVAANSAESAHIDTTEATVAVVAPLEEEKEETMEEVEDETVEEVKEVPEEPKEPVIEESVAPTGASIGPNVAEGAEETAVEAEPKLKPIGEESIVAESESGSTAAPAEDETDKETEVNSGESEQQTQQPDIESAESSEESDENSGEEPKAKAEDSTATPLVSYPPHNAGQTFDSNLADERSAYLSLSSSGRSTLIIALCSGTAVIFIVISLVIFVLSFQRQHGTLDIEMQEQRLGKDNLDEEDAQMKLLNVDLSTPVIIAMGNEETDECL